MDIVKVKLADLKLAEENVRMHPKRQIEEYRRSLSMFGQTKNAVIDENNNVLIGNGLVMAAREEGWEEIAAIKRTDLTENQKLKLMVSDNKIFGLGVDNLDTIDTIFERLHDDLNIPGYDEETLKTMIADTETVTAEIGNYGKLTPDEVRDIQNRPEPRTPTMPTPPAQTEQAASTLPHNDSDNNTAEPESRLLENEENSILIQCPKCGEKHWLPKDVLRPLM